MFERTIQGLDGGGFCGAFAPCHQLIGDFDDCVLPGRTDVLARLDPLVGETLAFGKAHSFDGRLFPVSGKVTRNRNRADLFAEKPQALCMLHAALVQARHGVQAVLAKDVEVRYRIGIKGMIRKRKLNDEPSRCFIVLEFHRRQCANGLRGLQTLQGFVELFYFARSGRRGGRDNDMLQRCELVCHGLGECRAKLGPRSARRRD